MHSALKWIFLPQTRFIYLEQSPNQIRPTVRFYQSLWNKGGFDRDSDIGALWWGHSDVRGIRWGLWYIGALRAGSHLNRTGTWSIFLCNSLATQCSVIFSPLIWMSWNKYYFSKTHCTKLHSTAVPRNVVQANVVRLQSAFGVSLGIHWHPQKIAHSVHFEYGVGMRISHTTFCCEHALMCASLFGICFVY